ncbi:MAG TPA: AI-2E family transporter [Longimicrobiales bacterium]
MNRRPYAVLIAAIFAVLLLLFLHRIAEVLLLFFIAILFAIYLSAITDSLQKRLAVPRAAGLMIALLITFVGIAGILWLIVPPVVEQTQGLIEAMPALMARWEADLIALASQSPFWAHLLGTLEPGESYTGIIVAQIGGYFRGVVPYLFSGITFAIHFISVLVMGMYLSLRPSLYREGFILLAPPVHRELVRDILGDLGRTLRAWIVGQILAMIVLGVFTWIGLELLRVPYALAFGVFTGAVAIVPFFGTLFSTLLPAIFVLGTGGIVQAFWVVMLGVGVHAFEANIVAPMIMERQVHLPPVLSILAVLIMAHLLHIVGLLVAVPVLCVVMVVGRRVYVHRVLEGKGFRRAIRDRPVELRLPDDGALLVHPAAFETTIPALLER